MNLGSTWKENLHTYLQKPVSPIPPIMPTLVWTYQVPGKEQVYGTPIVANHYGEPAIIVQSWDWFLYSFRATDGALNWRRAYYDASYGRAQAADVNSDGQLEIFGCSKDGNIYGMNQGGSDLWIYSNIYNNPAESQGTVTAAGSNYIEDSGKSWLPDQFLGYQGLHAFVEIMSGPGAGEKYMLADAGVWPTRLTVDTPWITQPTTSSTYQIRPEAPWRVEFMHAGQLNLEGGIWYLYVNGFDGLCVKLNAVTGARVWKFATQGGTESIPFLMDVDNDGVLEVIVSSSDDTVYCLDSQTGLQKWRTWTGFKQDAFVNAADIDGDGLIEIIIASTSSKVHVLRGDTGVEKFRTNPLGGDIDCRPALIDLYGNGTLGFVTGADSGWVTMFDHTGQVIWRHYVSPDEINSSPIVADIDYDGEQEILIPDMTGTITIFRKTGEILGQIHCPGAIEGTMLIEDIDGDGKLEMVITTLDGYIQMYRWD